MFYPNDEVIISYQSYDFLMGYLAIKEYNHTHIDYSIMVSNIIMRRGGMNKRGMDDDICQHIQN